jgi:hypothetical protein
MATIGTPAEVPVLHPMNQRLLTLTLSAAFVLAAGQANAQEQTWLKDRRYREGIGIRAGDFELHPGLGAEFGYDSNYFRRADNPDEDPIGSLRLRITPHFSLSTLGPQRTQGAPPPPLAFRAGIAVTYNEFFPVSGSDAGQDVMKDQRNVGGTLDARLDILPQREVFGSIFGELGRSITPSNEGDTAVSFNRLNVKTGGEIGWAPGGGLLDWRLGYSFGGTIFESDQFTQLTNIQHEARTRGRWRFLPRSALMYDARFGFISYPDGTGKSASHPLRTQLGYNGLVTNNFAVTALAGWGASFYDPPPGVAADQVEDFDSVIGLAEVKWYLTPNPSSDPQAVGLSLSSLAVGFQRDFFDSYIGTFYERDRGYANFSYFFGGSFLVALEGGVAAVVYPFVANAVPTSWTDIRIDSSLLGEYRFADSFAINSTIRYNTNISDTVLQVPAPGGAVAGDSLQWQAFEAYLGARWFM